MGVFLYKQICSIPRRFCRCVGQIGCCNGECVSGDSADEFGEKDAFQRQIKDDDGGEKTVGDELTEYRDGQSEAPSVQIGERADQKAAHQVGNSVRQLESQVVKGRPLLNLNEWMNG